MIVEDRPSVSRSSQHIHISSFGLNSYHMPPSVFITCTKLLIEVRILMDFHELSQKRMNRFSPNLRWRSPLLVLPGGCFIKLLI